MLSVGYLPDLDRMSNSKMNLEVPSQNSLVTATLSYPTHLSKLLRPTFVNLLARLPAYHGRRVPQACRQCWIHPDFPLATRQWHRGAEKNRTWKPGAVDLAGCFESN